ncbi:MAG: ATP-binding protein, partial [Nostocoides sp.]
YVLIEDLGQDIVVSDRDDGPGITPERLASARSEGRLGVVSSIQGRMVSAGGSATLITAPGEGAEWELRLPRGVVEGEGKR